MAIVPVLNGKGGLSAAVTIGRDEFSHRRTKGYWLFALGLLSAVLWNEGLGFKQWPVVFHPFFDNRQQRYADESVRQPYRRIVFRHSQFCQRSKQSQLVGGGFLVAVQNGFDFIQTARAFLQF